MTKTVEAYRARYQRLAFDYQERVLTIRMVQPGKLNAVDARMHKELSTIFAEVNCDLDIDIVVLTGDGDAFSAGGDTQWMNALIDKPGEWQRKAVESRQLWLNLLDLEKPLICRLNGPAMGMCATIVSLCDIVIASSTARIGDTHTKMALAAADGCNAIWPFIFGFQKTKDLLFNAKILSAEEAQHLGLITYVVEPADLDSAVADYVTKLQKGSIRTLQLTKMAVNFQMKQVVLPALENALNLLELSNFHPDHKEAVLAFNEKRRPVFKTASSEI